MGVPTAARAPSRGGTGRRDAVVWGALLLAVAVLVIGLVGAFAHAEPRRAATNGVQVGNGIGASIGWTICQAGESVPAGATALRLALNQTEVVGPTVEARLSRDGQVIGRGTLAGGWTGRAPGNVVTLPLDAATPAATDVDVCIRLLDGGAGVYGGPTPPGRVAARAQGRTIGGAIAIEYLRPGPESWWSFAPEAFERMAASHGRAGGTGVAVALVLALLGSATLAAIVLVRTVVRQRAWRATAVVVALVGTLNAVAWSVVTPPFYVPDEITHFAYVQKIGETGSPPVETARPRYSPELRLAMRDTFVSETIPQWRVAAWAPDAAARLQRDQARTLARVGDGSAKASNPEPPLYYALGAVPYALAGDAPLLDRLALIRLLGAALAGITALFTFLFVRELLPGAPWAWSVGALVVAFAPMVGSVAGGVNPDALLYPVCAALFYLLARAFRQGLTPQLAGWIGVVIALGMIGKINFYGLVPGALLAVAFAARASAGGWNGRALRLGAIVLAAGFGPYLLMHLLDALVWDRGNILWRDTSAANDDHGGLVGQLVYLWQVYLPPLPGMAIAEPGEPYIGYELWFKTWFGTFASNIVLFADWAYALGLGICLLLLGLASRVAYVRRAVLRRRRAELLAYAAMVGGMLLLIGIVAVRGWAPDLPAAAQGRYLLPLMALFAALVALGVRGAGGEDGRRGRALGAVLVVAAVAWNLFGQLHTIEHFYA